MSHAFSIFQVKAILLSMAEDEEVALKCIENFFLKFLLRVALPYQKLHYPFIARCNINQSGEVIKHVNRCSYNPNKNKIVLQRCNYPCQQVFYGAIPCETENVSADMTAMLETTLEYVKNKKVSQLYMTLSRWTIIKPIYVYVLPFSKKSSRHNKDFRQLNKLFQLELRKLTNDDEVEYKYLLHFLEFLSEVFCKKKSKQKYYRISSAFYNAIMKLDVTQKFNIEGLIYPSANSKAEGMNVVLQKVVVDEYKLDCDMAIMYKMQRTPNNVKEVFFSYVSNEVSPDSNGNFRFTTIY